MAKRKKLQDNNPPRRVEIRGQDHLLAYITPEEAQLLMDNGGSGKPGPMGIPAFYDEGDDYSGPGGDDGSNDFGLSDDFGGNDVGNAIAEANRVVSAQLALADSMAKYGPTAPSSMTPQEMAFEQTPAAQRIAQSYINNASVFGPEVFSGNRIGGSIPAAIKSRDFSALMGVPSYSNYFDDPAVNQAFSGLLENTFENRMERAKSIPGKLGAIGQFSIGQMQKALEKGGRPVFDAQGQLKGVFSEGPFGFGEVYTGMPVEGVEGTGYDEGGERGNEPIKPTDPETGQCPEGYIFDEDLQACRLDTGGVAASSAASQAFAPGAYARMSLLDQAPQGLLQVSGQPYDFDAANKAFRMATATRPEYYSDPYDLTGYTLLA